MFGRFLRLIEELTKQIFSSGFSAVRSRAMETAPRSLGVQLCFHRGAILTVLCFKQVCIEASTITSCRYIYIYIHIQSHTRIYIYIYIYIYYIYIYTHTNDICTYTSCMHLVCAYRICMYTCMYRQGGHGRSVPSRLSLAVDPRCAAASPLERDQRSAAVRNTHRLGHLRGLSEVSPDSTIIQEMVR